jgi:hypothetical protein
VQVWAQPLLPLYDTSGTAYASSTTLTDVSPGGTTNPIAVPAYSLQKGMLLRLRASGTFSNTGTPTLLLGFYLGGTAGTALAATSAITTTTGATNWPWALSLDLRVRTTGSSGTVMPGMGYLDLPTSLTAFTHRPIPETALATVTWDTTATKTLTVGAQWGTSSASNTLTCLDLNVELLG